MPQKIETLEYDCIYHIYNRGINRMNIFEDTNDHLYFLKQWEKYLTPVATIYAYCLMNNHFHFLIKIKSENEIIDNQGSPLIINKLIPSRQLSNLFNGYAKAFNKKYDRIGSLFQRPFKRKKITNIDYLRFLIFYIHNNPVHHGFCEQIKDYSWSSYKNFLSYQNSFVDISAVVEWFDDLENFIFFHKQMHEIDNAKKIILE